MSMKFIALFLCLVSVASAQDIGPLKATLEKQARHETVAVKFRQTKTSPALSAPVKSSGQLWMAPGKAFRWEVQSPKTQTAVYDGSRVTLIDEKKKEGVIVSPDDKRAKPLLLMLGMNEGRSTTELLKAFKVVGTNQVDEHFIVSLKPTNGRVRKAVSALVMQVNQKTNFMERIEWTQRDGTKTVTEFFPPKINGGLPADTFKVQRQDISFK